MSSFISKKQEDEKGTFDVKYTSINFMPEQKCVKIEGEKRYYDANGELYHIESFSRNDRNEPEQIGKRFVYDGEELESQKVDESTNQVIEPDDIVDVVVKAANPKYDNWCMALEPTLNEKL